MTEPPVNTPVEPRRRGAIAAMLIALVLVLGGGRATAAPETPGTAAKKGSEPTSWIRSGAIFLVISTVGAYAWYFGFFPRLLRKSNPSWPLDAWRYASYGAWITTCLAAYAFKGPMTAKVIEPLLRGSPSALIANFMELVFLPLLALVGLLVIWNFRRDAAGRLRPA